MGMGGGCLAKRLQNLTESWLLRWKKERKSKHTKSCVKNVHCWKYVHCAVSSDQKRHFFWNFCVLWQRDTQEDYLLLFSFGVEIFRNSNLFVCSGKEILWKIICCFCPSKQRQPELGEILCAQPFSCRYMTAHIYSLPHHSGSCMPAPWAQRLWFCADFKMLWSAEKMLDGQHQRADLSVHARTVDNGLPQKKTGRWKEISAEYPVMSPWWPKLSRDWTEVNWTMFHLQVSKLHGHSCRLSAGDGPPGFLLPSARLPGTAKQQQQHHHHQRAHRLHHRVVAAS